MSDEDDQESLERRVARLKRELEEVKEEHAKRKAAGQEVGQETQFASLSNALEEISKSAEVVRERTFAPAPTFSPPQQTSPPVSNGREDGATYTITYAPTYEQSHTLAKAADFDRRLVLLEKAIGVSSTAVPGIDAAGLPRAIMPTLESLQKQISTLSQAPTSTLDTVSRKLRQLVQEAEQLDKARAQAKAAQEALGSGAGNEDAEQVAKVNALYGTLPTIESLTPLLPPLLDRLRSLRAIHSEAATASETLDRIEKQQTEMASDLKQWRDGLEKVEGAIREGGSAMSGNVKVMEGWVKDLEGRMAKLG